jgi:hypothetical protein
LSRTFTSSFTERRQPSLSCTLAHVHADAVVGVANDVSFEADLAADVARPEQRAIVGLPFAVVRDRPGTSRHTTPGETTAELAGAALAALHHEPRVIGFDRVAT